MSPAKKTHKQLVERAGAWLLSYYRCQPILLEHASCPEIPDAIGWCPEGSVVIECKTSRADYGNEADKYARYFRSDNPENVAWAVRRSRILSTEGMVRVDAPRMGNRRFFLCEPGIISEGMVVADHPDHGLLYAKGNRVSLVKIAERRENVALESEIKMLRLAMVHMHKKLTSLGIFADLDDLTRFKLAKYIRPIDTEITREFADLKRGFNLQPRLFS